MQLSVSATIITLNEEANIERCLNSLQWAAEVVVVDSGSTDRTLEICQVFGARVVRTPWLGFGRTKQLAVEHASNDWIFSIDADEQVSPELEAQIKKVFSGQPEFNAYHIQRLSHYLGKPIRHCGWDRDRPLRLFRKDTGVFNDKPVHESVEVDCETSLLSGPLLHYPYPSVFSHLEKMNRYTELAADEAVTAGKRATPMGATLRGVVKFFKMFILQSGFLDGRIGWALAKNSAFGVYLKYLKIWQKSL